MQKSEVEKHALEHENNLKQDKIDMLHRIVQARENEIEGVQRRQRIQYNIGQTYGTSGEPILAKNGKSVISRQSRASSAMDR